MKNSQNEVGSRNSEIGSRKEKSFSAFPVPRSALESSAFILLLFFILQVSAFRLCSAADSTPVKTWSIDTGIRHAPYTLSLLRGETAYLQPQYLNDRVVSDLSDVTSVTLRYRDSSMTNTYHSATGYVYIATNGYIRIPWGPTNESYASAYTYSVQCVRSNGSTLSGYGAINLRASVDGSNTNVPPVYTNGMVAGTLIVTNSGSAGQIAFYSSGSPSNSQYARWGDAGFLVISSNLSDLAHAGTARTNLGLGTAATSNVEAFATAAQGALADSATQPSDDWTNTVAGLAAIALTNNAAQAAAAYAWGNHALAGYSTVAQADNMATKTNWAGAVVDGKVNMNNNYLTNVGNIHVTAADGSIFMDAHLAGHGSLISMAADTDSKLPLIYMRDTDDDKIHMHIGIDRASAYVTGTAQNDAFVVADENAALHLGTEKTARMTIRPGGLVGIGTTNPVTTLDVVGNISCINYLGGGASLTGVAKPGTTLTINGVSGTLASNATYTVTNVTSSARSAYADTANQATSLVGVVTADIMTNGANVSALANDAFYATTNQSGNMATKTNWTGAVVDGRVNFNGNMASNMSVLLVNTSMAIGTNAATYDLDIVTDSTTDGRVKTRSPSSLARWEACSDLNARSEFRAYGSTNVESFLGNTMSNYIALICQDNRGLAIGNAGNTPIIFGVNNLEKMRLANTGYLGIGTNTPATPLHIFASGATPQAAIRLSTPSGDVGQLRATSAAFVLESLEGSAGGHIYIRPMIVGDVATNNTVFISDTGGNVMIGTNTTVDYTKKLDVGGDIRLRGDNAKINFYRETGPTDIAYIEYNQANGTFGLTANAKAIVFSNKASWAESMRITSGGFVGIGTNNPATALDVNGNMTLRGSLTNSDAFLIGSGANLLTLGQGGPVVITGTNFFFYNSATNWAGSWANYTGYYHGINSNGAIRVLTNAWGW